MASKLTDQAARAAAAPTDRGMRTLWDTEVRGFGLRVLRSGSKAWVVAYRNADGVQRTMTVGSFPDWSAKAAREQAAAVKRDVDAGHDPLQARRERRAAPTVADLWQLYTERHLPKKRPSSQAEDRRLYSSYIEPALGRLKGGTLDRHAIEAKIGAATAHTKVQARLALSLLSVMYRVGIEAKAVTTNPTIGIARPRGQMHERFLAPDEVRRLVEVLDRRKDQSSDVVRLLLLTGARRGEVLGARWSDFDLDGAVWDKPSTATKQKKRHRVPLNPAAVELLRRLAERKDDPVFVFPRTAPNRTGHANPYQTNVKNAWRSIRKEAGIPDVRLHDLRHNFASVLANAGIPLQVVGAMLGHSNVRTTERYAHLYDSTLRDAADVAGKVIDFASRRKEKPDAA
jgi:integrase